MKVGRNTYSLVKQDVRPIPQYVTLAHFRRLLASEKQMSQRSISCSLKCERMGESGGFTVSSS